VRISESANDTAGSEKAQLDRGHRNDGSAVRSCLSLAIEMNSQYTLWMERLQLCINCVVQKLISYVLENLSTVVHSARFEGLTPLRLNRRYDIDLFVNCKWLDTRCSAVVQYTFTHKQYTEQHN
jgi:hypothetical protein